MKIAILGTRGIPNNHGGFEQFAEYFSVYLVQKGHNVFVYNSHNHPYQQKEYHGVNILYCYDPEHKIGTTGQFVYDFNCIMDSRKRGFDVILQLGYTSSSIWHWLMPRRSLIITNMDGLEWKRSKYSKNVRKFLKHAEKLAVKNSDYLISDSKGIQEYISNEYQKDSEFIAYGASLFTTPDETVLKSFDVVKEQYCMIIARLEPENNIETILEGFDRSGTNHDLIIFGGLNAYGMSLKKKYAHNKLIRFLGPNYNLNQLNNLRHFSRFYFHGHSVGGTNPSLLEAMGSNCLIVANDNIFNRSILGNDALYFNNASDIVTILENESSFKNKNDFTYYNSIKIEKSYNRDIINQAYENFILKCLG